MAISEVDNMDKCQMAGPRARIDTELRQIVDQIDDAYYGTPQYDGQGNFTGRAADGWKDGISQPFLLWDYVDGEDNKLKFTILSGTLHDQTFLAQHLFNCDHDQHAGGGAYTKYPETKYNEIRNEAGALIETKVRKVKRVMRQRFGTWNSAGLTPTMTRPRMLNIVDWVKTRPVVAELLTRRVADNVELILDPDDETDVST